VSGTEVARLLAGRRRTTGRSARDVSLSAGLSESVMGKIEAGTMEPSLRVFAQVAAELGLNDREIVLLVRLAGQGSGASTISTA
jgi:predicted transcriptional regulator